MMDFKIALRNVKKSFKDYGVYFLTLTLAVCIFYTFNSIGSQRALIELNNSGKYYIDQLIKVMSYVSIFVVFILGSLILYANKFLIKRRNKEFGIYIILGMGKFKISKILILETVIVGFFSLISGILIGLFLSQGVSILTLNLFDINMDEYKFVISIASIIKTSIYFGIMFLISSMSVLTLQQLSEASDSIYRYKSLKKLGVSNREINKTIFTQVFIYFSAPICLAIVHSIVGIKVMNDFRKTFNRPSIFLPSFVVMIVILIVYLLYFYVTYTTYTNVVKNEIKNFLEKYSYEVIVPDDFENVIEFILNRESDLILLDINLPVYDGYYICKEVRKKSNVPIIIVTSRDSDMDELMSINFGADDFITKPYNIQILLARIGALLKRVDGIFMEFRLFCR